MFRKTLMTLTLSLLVMSGLTQARQQATSKDLFLNFQTNASQSSGSGGQSGKPGARVQIERKRNGRLAFVSPTQPILSGDQIAFRTTLNFAGYLTVLNFGTSGKISTLYYGQVNPGKDMRIPAEGWITVAGPAGKEVVNFMMSGANPFQGAAVQPVPVPSSGGSVTYTTSTGAPTAQSDVQSVLDAANARALENGKRDLLPPDTLGNETFVLANTTQIPNRPLGFSITLNHK